MSLTAQQAAAPPVSARPVLEGRGLTKFFSVKHGRGIFAGTARLFAVDDVSVALAPGTVTALVGESGSGKTTVARMLAKIINPDGGKVLLDGEPVSGRPRSYARQVQMVFQDPFASLNPIHRINYHLIRPLKIHGLGGDDVNETVEDLLRRVALEPPQQFTRKFPHELSGGQRQRVAIARALANQPALLLADEPTGNLDSRTSIEIMGVFQALNAAGITIVMVTHELDIASYCKRIIIMRDGEILSDELNPKQHLASDELALLNQRERRVQLA